MNKKLKFYYLFATTFLLSAFFFINPQQSYALNGNDFPFGRIIDDVIFRDKDSMTVPQIQAFLNSKVNGGACDRWRPSYNPDYQPPYTCLFEFQQNPATGENNYGKFNPDGSPASVPGGQSAAQIIWQASQDYNINPQVLIVLLQKEQGLVTDNWPWTRQYSKATGFNCPDTAPCSPATADFSKQVRGAAWSFNFYIENLDRYWYGIGSNDILYNPNSACGRKTINIENAATVALYLYTPYVPNQAALDNLYGTGDSCSAYGNRNFWRYFRDWFGAVHTDAYNYSFVSSSNANPSMEPGRYINGAYIRLRNEGSETWYRDGFTPENQAATRLAIVGYKKSKFADLADPYWLGTGNQVMLLEQSVPPGQIGTFRFDLRSPYSKVGDTEDIYFRPVVNGVAPMPFKGLRFRIKHASPSYQILSSNLPSTLNPGEIFDGSMSIKNTGFSTWYSDGNQPVGIPPTRLTLNNYLGSIFSDTTDMNYLSNSQVTMSDISVAPGQTATFNFRLKAPMSKASEKVNFNLVYDGATFFEANKNWYFWPSIPEPQASYTFDSAVNPTSAQTVGQTYSAELRIRNTGNIAWGTSANETGTFPLRLIVGGTYSYSSVFYEPGLIGWLTHNQIEYIGPVVKPGEIATIKFDWKPSATGSFSEKLVPVLDGFVIMKDRGMQFNVSVSE